MVDNLVCSESSRLVANIIVAYNALILNKLYENLCARYGEEKAKKYIAKNCPVAWSHISFTGKYLFKNGTNVIDMESLISMLEAIFLSKV